MNVNKTIWLGVILVLLGIALILIPTLGRFIELGKIPNWLIYVYKINGFYFVTSPILILFTALIGVLFLLLY